MRTTGITSLLLGLLITLGSSGSIVPEDQARRAARNFFFERASQYQEIQLEDIDLEPAITIFHQDVRVYYVFNINPDGFIIVSAWDEAYPFLGYAYEGEYREYDRPDNFSAWMEQYARQIYHAVSENIAPDKHTRDSWDYYLNTSPENLRPFRGREVQPLLTTTWNQGMYYNELCPADPAGPGGHCYAGCVATAMGQVMNYFRWPDTGTGGYSYNCPPYGTLSVNYDSTAYRWELMETSINHSNLYIAELLYHLGVSVDMVYGPDGSGMYNHKAAYSLRTYFKYSPETRYVYRDSTTMDWDSLLVSHLDRKIPMYYAGWSVPNIYGHAFVCDGYQDSAHYHFNWGWSGSYDGYFYTDNLTPGGNNFNLAQELIINAIPDTSAYSYPLYCSGDHEYSTLFGSIDDGSGPLFPYAGQSDCSWLIAPDDTINGLTLDFINFNFGDGDTLRVFSGPAPGDSLLAEYTSASQPGSLNTEANQMFLTFSSDDSLSGEGFLAEFISDLPVFCSGTTTLTGQTDILSDGSGSYNYQDNTLCKWKILPEDASEVTLYFTDFETEEGSDLVQVYDYSTLQLLAEYSGSYPSGPPEPVTSPSGKMFITFMTNSTVREQGWTAYYETDLVGVPEKHDRSGFKIFPNPSSGILFLEFHDDGNLVRHLTIADPSGRKVHQQILPGNNTTHSVNLNHLNPGLYILSMDTKIADPVISKIIIY